MIQRWWRRIWGDRTDCAYTPDGTFRRFSLPMHGSWPVSFAIGGKVNRARMSAQAYQVQSVPLIIVDGKFVSNRIPSHAAIPPLIDALVATARAERPTS